uniref:Fibronectin type III-like domain-containing protein n=1 Tax=Kalanchoe fedtschenkoi TaxID=63787 RepID=A0A7N0TDX3_KALFE
MALVSAVAESSHKPLILVLTGGGPLDVSFAQHDPRIASILWIGYPGEAGPKALAQIIFGDHNPGGRLPMTWYPESYTSVAMNDMSMRADPSRGFPGRTYRFYTGDQVYGFGGGLSYTKYEYKLMSGTDRISLSEFIKTSPNEISEEQHQVDNLNFIQVDRLSCCDALKFYVQISVTNAGEKDGSHAVLLFARLPKHVPGTPEKQLVGFSRVHTTSRGTTEAVMLVDPCEHLSTADENGIKVLPLGDHVLMVDDLENSVSIMV